MGVFQDYAYYYNAFYKDKDYKQEAKQVDEILKRYDSQIKEIMNLGCGTGRHDIELDKLGYQCKGIDISPEMIETAKKNALSVNANIDFEVADIRTYEEEKSYDAVISLFHVMSYQSQNIDVLNALKTARKLLYDTGKSGYFLFDVWYGPGVLSDKPSVKVKEVEDEKNRLIRIARPVMYNEKNLVDVNYEIFIIDKETKKVRMIQEVHTMRYFFRPELELLLSEAGFELVDNLDCQTLEATDFTSWTSYFIAKAI